ncbi:hypothetical protein KI688_011678 [Linnemannia hyalina]|uniref:Uncharacterized protein n=1 Tax=Linnemannia hyalina TaxID=64524 RepID=A0A9P7XYM1_9FUNG|nr:hypothetical protein KI688_011678 [Linnemannia hyalina]
MGGQIGAGEAGKTTIIKQMKLMHASGFSDTERQVFRTYVFSNMVASMKSILMEMQDRHIGLTNLNNEKYLPVFVQTPRLGHGTAFPPKYREAINSLWTDPSVQQVFRFFDAVDRIYEINYIPSDADILRCRVKSTGITETAFHMGKLTYRMFDVGGQRSERKKWIHCFEAVTAVLFLVAISGYDQCLVEDKDSNQMEEALMLFDQVCNSHWFIDTSMIMFMNKTDIFRAKIQYSPIRAYFPDYPGPEGDYDEAIGFFRSRFMRLNRSEHKEVYIHYTDATDTNLLRNIMDSVNNIILARNNGSVVPL